MQIEFGLATADRALVDAVMAKVGATPGDCLDLGSGLRLQFDGVTRYRDPAAVDVVNLILSFPVGVAAGVVAQRLYEYLASKDANSSIREVRFRHHKLSFGRQGIEFTVTESSRTVRDAPPQS